MLSVCVGYVIRKLDLLQKLNTTRCYLFVLDVLSEN